MKMLRILAATALWACATGREMTAETPAAQAAGTDTGSETALGDEARFQKAKALADGGKLAEAEAAFTEILEKHPTSRFKQRASMELGLVQARLGKKHDAEQTLKAARETMSEPEKTQADVALKH